MKKPIPAMADTILIVTIVMATCLVVLQCVKVPEEEEEVEVSKDIRDIDLSTWMQSYNENQILLVLLYPLIKCNDCPALLANLAQMYNHAQLPTGLLIAKSSSADLTSKLGIEQLPALVYLRDKSHVVYDGNYSVPDLVEWAQLATNKITQRLDDESSDNFFKEVNADPTRAWVVVFYKDVCKSALPLLEAFGVRVYGQVSVGKVNILDSPKLAETYQIINCPEIIFFKQGKKIYYELSALDSNSLRDFVDRSNKSIESGTVPVGSRDAGFVAGNFSEYIKTYSQRISVSAILASVGILAAILVFFIACCCRSGGKGPKKSKKD